MRMMSNIHPSITSQTC